MRIFAADNTAMNAAENGTISDTARMDVRLRCPRCRLNMDGLDCLFCGFQ